MKNLVSAARAWIRQPENSIKDGIKTGIKIYVMAAMLMFLLGFSATIYQGLS